MDERYFPISFHTGIGGDARGLGNYFRALDEAGEPAGEKGADEYGPCFELANLARTSGVPHIITFRLTSAAGDYDYDNPPYDMQAKDGAALHWAETGCGRCGGADMTCDESVDLHDLRELADWWLVGE